MFSWLGVAAQLAGTFNEQIIRRRYSNFCFVPPSVAVDVAFGVCVSLMNFP